MRLLILLAAAILLAVMLLAPADGAEIEMDGLSNDVLAVEALIEKFDSPDTIVRYEPWFQTVPAFVAYAEAAASFGDCAVDPLIVALKGENPQVRVAAAIALEAVGPASIKAKPILEEMLQSDDDYANIQACCVIRGIGPGAVDLVDSVIVCLDSENFHVQYWACRALGGVGREATLATNKLLDLLTTGVASVRRNAALALGEIYKFQGEPGSIIQPLEQVIENDWSVPVKDAAQEALINIRKLPC